MISDLFSHKIHSSRNEWPDKLSELAAIFAEFDGEIYNREAFEERLTQISPRASYLTESVAKEGESTSKRLDVSKFRDEISAYPAYLGLYFLEQSPSGWIVRISETAKRFLVCEEPDVGSFLRLQLPLFQYPNAMGAAYRSFTNKLRIQANACKRTLGFINEKIHLSPMRLIAIALNSDADLRNVDVLEACVSFKEIFGLANTPNINQYTLPLQDTVSKALNDIRQGKIHIPDKYEKRFHILRHTEMFLVEKGCIKFRKTINKIDKDQLLIQFNSILSINNEFNNFDHCNNAQELETIVASGLWGQYFDGVKVIPANIVEALTNDKAIESNMPLETDDNGEIEVIPNPVAEIYPFRERTKSLPKIKPYNRRREMADPELTRIKRQRRNLAHKELIDKMDGWLRQIGAIPKENDHIDLFAKIPSDGSFIFEMKSGGENILEQIRKGLSQLYEYRYRYSEIIDDQNISLCLVLPNSPEIPWIIDYLCNDRNINVCWFESSNNLVWPESCEEQMKVLAS